MKNVSKIMFGWCLTFDAVYSITFNRINIFFTNNIILFQK